MYRYTVISTLLVGTLALPQVTAAMESGTHNEDVSGQTQQDAMGKTVIPEYHQPGTPITTDKIRGTSVRTSDGKDIGNVHNIVVNKDGQITHLIVDTGHTINNGDLVAIPWQLVERTRDFIMTAGDGPIHVRVSKSVVDGAPTITGRGFPLPHADSSIKLANHYFRKAFSKQDYMGQTTND